jgi:hypothetical protein
MVKLRAYLACRIFGHAGQCCRVSINFPWPAPGGNQSIQSPPLFRLFVAASVLGRDQIRSDQIRFVMYVLPNLVQNTAMRNLRLIDGSGIYAVHTIRACFYLRMQTVNSYAVNPETLSSNPARLFQTSFCGVRVHDRAHSLSCFDDPAAGTYASLDILK